MSLPAVPSTRRRPILRTLTRGFALALIPLMPACGQDWDERLPAMATASTSPAASVTPQVAAPTHPLMSPQAIAAAAANFDQCISSLWPHASQRGVSRTTFDAATRGLVPDLEIMERLDHQPEFTRPIWEYLELLVSDERIANGREMLARHAETFAAVERAYGVDRHVIAAIWGVESNYGTRLGDRPVVRSTATLACIGRRQNYFRDEFLAALQILDRGDVPADQFRGSWAGAFGQTQFMPTSFQRHAVDFSGDKRRNIVGSVADAFASTANMLKKAGWQTGAAWGYEVTLPQNFDFLLVDRSTRKSLREWESLGVRRVGGSAFPRPGDQGYLLLPSGGNGPAFVVIENFRVIMRYNPSESYALAVGHLADRLRGGQGFVRPWPRNELPLSNNERFEMQERLAALGLYRGDSDGKFGPLTRAAIREFQVRAGLVPDGFANSKVLERLRQAR